VPAEADGIQVNFCKNPACGNYGVLPKESVLRGRVAQGSQQDTYIIQSSGDNNVPSLLCRVCGEQPRIKSNAAIAEERARFLKNMAVAPEASCPDESCSNHSVSLGKGYQSKGLTKSGSRRYRCNVCKKTFSVGKSTTGHKQPHKNRLIFSLLMNKSPFRRICEVADIGPESVYGKISFIQRFVLFLGYPTYSLTVVLLALLVSTGVGSWLTDRVRSGFEEKLPSRLVLLLAMVGAYLVAVPWIFDALLGAPLAVRIAVAISLLAPLGLVLGGFLPLGVRVLERTNRQLVPWAWAVNGCATVVGTILAVIGGMTWSFTTVALAACAIYAAGVAALVAAERRARSVA